MHIKVKVRTSTMRRGIAGVLVLALLVTSLASCQEVEVIKEVEVEVVREVEVIVEVPTGISQHDYDEVAAELEAVKQELTEVQRKLVDLPEIVEPIQEPPTPKPPPLLIPSVPEPEETVLGPAEQLTLELSDLGPGWEGGNARTQYEGKLIEYNFSLSTNEDKYRLSWSVNQRIVVYPEAESLALDAPWKDVVNFVGYISEKIAAGRGWSQYGDNKVKLRNPVLNWSFWDESYLDSVYLIEGLWVVGLRSGTTLVIFKSRRKVSEYNALTESYVELLYHEMSPELKAWVNRYGDQQPEFLHTLADIIQGKITSQE